MNCFATYQATNTDLCELALGYWNTQSQHGSDIAQNLGHLGLDVDGESRCFPVWVTPIYFGGDQGEIRGELLLVGWAGDPASNQLAGFNINLSLARKRAIGGPLPMDCELTRIVKLVLIDEFSTCDSMDVDVQLRLRYGLYAGICWWGIIRCLEVGLSGVVRNEGFGR